MPDSHGQYFVIDVRNREYDTDINILVTKKTMPEIPLKIELSMTVCIKSDDDENILWILLFLFLLLLNVKWIVPKTHSPMMTASGTHSSRSPLKEWTKPVWNLSAMILTS